MSECRIIVRAVNIPNMAVQPDWAPSEGWCETHQMHPGLSGMCAIGQIEAATAAALAQIAEAKK